MPSYCCISGCESNRADAPQASFFRFPKPEYEEQRKIWINFVNRQQRWAGPTVNTRLCQLHFEQHHFANYLKFKEGFVSRLYLRTNAVPTIMLKRSLNEAEPQSSSQSVTPIQPQEMEIEDILQEESIHPEEADVDDADATLTLFPASTSSVLNAKFVEVGTQTEMPTSSKICQVDIRLSKVAAASQTYFESENLPIIHQRESTPKKKLRPPQLWFTPIKAPSDIAGMPSETSGSRFTLDSEILEEESAIQGVESKDVEEKFIVSRSKLLHLFQQCFKCGGGSLSEIVHREGTMVVVEQSCSSQNCSFKYKWTSQRIMRRIPEGNLLLSAAIFCTGLSAAKVIRLFNKTGINCISDRSHFDHTKDFVQPIINRMWLDQKTHITTSLKQEGKRLVLAGDGRCDSPGHTAKYGTYTFLELELNKIVSINLVQSNQTSSSNAMELEGFKRCVNDIENSGLHVDELVTDRHVQIRKYVREKMENTHHYFDVWHLAKGLKGKLNSLAKKSGNEEITSWIKSIINHLYWSASSSIGQPGQMILDKWLSVINHVSNVHEGHSELFPRCLHDDLTREETARKKWIEDTAVKESLKTLLSGKQLCNDVRMLSTKHQTSRLEAFHSLLIHFIPKHTAFSYKGMLCRQMLAAMHYNENSDKNKSNENRKYRVIFPKYKHKEGGYSMRLVNKKSSYHYIDQVLSALLNVDDEEMENLQVSMDAKVVPPPLCFDFERPEGPTTSRSRFVH